MAACGKVFGTFLLFLLGLVFHRGNTQERRFYSFSAINAAGISIPFEKYQGKVTLVTNVASYCGYTDNHYKQYVRLKEEHGDWLNILAFPCNQFGEQEPEDVHTITREMRRKYMINFEIFEKIETIGENVPDFWKYLNEESKTTPQWNFFKYLIDAHGQVIGAWGPRAGVDHIRQSVEDAIREAKRLHDREEL